MRSSIAAASGSTWCRRRSRSCFAYGGASAYGYLTEGRERRFLRAAFSRYLAPEVVEELVAEPGRLALGGETREMTVMFADVAGFTSLAERADAARARRADERVLHGGHRA